MFVSYPCAGRMVNRTGRQSGAARALVAAAPHVDRVHPRPGCTLERAGDAADAHVAPAPAEDDRAMIRRPHPGAEDGVRRAGGAPAPALSLIHISEPTRLGMISYAVFCL